MQCVNCGAELAQREDICSLCGKPAITAGDSSAPTRPAVSEPVKPAQTAAPSSTATETGAAFCPQCNRYVYINTDGVDDRGHPLSSMKTYGTQVPDAPILPGAGRYGTGLPVEDMYQNTSGQGELTVLPPELRGWNWGAFLLTWIWGAFNNVWIALLMLVPVANYVMPFVLGFKGNEWAWKNKRWEGVHHFRETQRKWAIGGLIYWAVLILLIIVLIALSMLLATIRSGSSGVSVS